MGQPPALPPNPGPVQGQPALLFAGAAEGAHSQSPLLAGAHIQPPLQPMQPLGEIRGKLLLLWPGREAALPGARGAADTRLCKAPTVPASSRHNWCSPTLTRQLIPITPIASREFPLRRRPEPSPSHVPAAGQSRAKQSRADSPSHPPACSCLLHGGDLGSQMAPKHQR